MSIFIRQHGLSTTKPDVHLPGIWRSLWLAFAGCALASSAHASLTEIAAQDQLILEALNTPVLQHEIEPTPERERKRDWFQQAEEALERGQTARYGELKARLQDYPLYPYLELQELQNRFHIATGKEVQDLVARYPHVPLAELVETRWLHELGRRQDWPALLERMPETASGNSLRCLQLRARLETGGVSAITDDMAPLWLTGHSLPDACDPVLEAWREAGELTDDLLWQRAALAIKAGNGNLARYLKRYMSPGLKSATDALMQVHRDPARLKNMDNFTADRTRATEIVSHGMLQYSRQSPEKAAKLWPRYRQSLPFTPAQLSIVNRTLGLMLAVRYLPQAPALLTEARAAHADPNLYEWEARVYLRNGDWRAVAETIHEFPKHLRTDTRWQYWLARAEEQLGHHDDAQARYARAAEERNFYGFMAADRLGAPYRLNHQSHPVDPAALAEIQAKPAVRRAYEFYQMGRLREARHEWAGLLSRLEPDQVLLASQLARSWGWHEQGVRGAIVAQQWDDLQMRFPLAHQELFTNHATLRKLDVNWVYALARQESAFMPDARSSAGALGLLQLMPATARQTAREAGLPFSGREQLLDPARNIELGTAHLAELLAQFGNNRILATAAYNAGAYRVTEWLKNGGAELDADVWIETMPYYETRQYVQNVLAYTVIYGYRRGEPPGHLLTERELACLCLADTTITTD